ncbi:hypothetical protein, partial [Streptomyces hirsutus]|uniref:hypothetical protein n=1 Tax=Streptomyces hirsutus TaxID=35620 RepID=UPI0033220A5D
MSTDHSGNPGTALIELRAQLEAGRIARHLTKTLLATRAGLGRTVVTELELVMSLGRSGGSDGQAGLGETAVYEVAA